MLTRAARLNKKTLPPRDQLDDLFSRIYSEEVKEDEEEDGGREVYSEEVREEEMGRNKNTVRPEFRCFIIYKRC